MLTLFTPDESFINPLGAASFSLNAHPECLVWQTGREVGASKYVCNGCCMPMSCQWYWREPATSSY